MCDFTELFGEEIVLLVFSFLPVADLHRAARVNTTWMRIALDQQVWKIRCKKGGRRGVMEHMVAYYKSKKRSVPWRDIYSVLYHQHQAHSASAFVLSLLYLVTHPSPQFSATDKSEGVSLTENDTVATAQNYLNVTVKCRERMVPSARQPFHYYQILIVEKKYTHMSIGITDRDWGYTGNLVGFGQNCYNYAFHSNGLILHNSNSEVDKVPMYGTGDSVGLLVQYEDKTKRPATSPGEPAGEPSPHTGVTLQFRTSTSAAGENSGADGRPSSAMSVDTEAGNERQHSEDDEAEEGAEGEVGAGSGDSVERDNEDDGDGDGDDDGGGGGGGGGGSVRIRRQRTPIEVLMQLAAAEQQKQQQASTSSDAAALTKRPRKGPKLVLYLFLNGQWCYTWNYTRPPPHAEIAFTVALNGTGACVALNREEDPAHREKRQELNRANALTTAMLPSAPQRKSP